MISRRRLTRRSWAPRSSVRMPAEGRAGGVQDFAAFADGVLDVFGQAGVIARDRLRRVRAAWAVSSRKGASPRRQARAARTVEATSSSSSGPRTPPTRPRSAKRHGCRARRPGAGRAASPGSRSASAVVACRRRASSSSPVGTQLQRQLAPAEKLVCRASSSRTATNSSVSSAKFASGSAAETMATRQSTGRHRPYGWLMYPP